MPSRSRDRHLAKQAARRQQERAAAKRRRGITLGSIGAVVGLVAIVVGAIWLFGGDDDTTPAASTTPSASASVSPGADVKPGERTGTVDPGTPATATVACDGKVPAAASEPKPQFQGPPPMTVDPKTTYTATLETSCGTIVIQLDPKQAPQTTNSFVFLAQQGYFDGTFFHRVVDSIDVIQGGDPTGSGSGGPGYTIPDELTGSETYIAGTIAMANGGPNTGGSQFFIITGPQGTNLDGNPAYTIFGQVAEGLDVAKEINALMAVDDGTFDGAPTEAVYIDRVTIQES
jgi:cyclophilin family peptidyl-prolyl cis-trans isomerase